jgi:hypothetical protein
MKSVPALLLAGLAFLASPVAAQYGGHMALANSPIYEAAAAPLRNAPPRQYNFTRAVLVDVMRLMAEDAGIGFFGLPEGAGAGDNLVTFTLTASPFVALETLAKANGVALIHDNGIWYLRPANDQELIGRIYEINYNAQELVTKNNQAAVGMGGGMGGGGMMGGGMMGGGMGGGMMGGGMGGGLNLQGSPDFFVIEPSRILEDIQNILDIPSTGGSAVFAPTASVDNVAQLSVGGFQGQPDLVFRPGSRNGGGADPAASQSKVIWNSDSNTLYVVATRQQHQWIEAYLASADRPQPMIAVEVKFIETSRDPSSELGIDWNGVLGSNGLEVTLSDATGPIDLNNVGGYALPTAVLSYSDLNLKLRALYGDRRSRTVSYPRMVTLDNREVSFRSVVNQPVLGSSASASLGAGATEVAQIEYLPIGTVINILPKRMAGNKILLNVSVTVSDIIGTEFINGNPFPIATSRVYTAPLTVQSGYTVAISGLDAARISENETGVPILGRLPVIGYAFKNRRQDRSRQHLMMLITPVALNTGTEGLTEKPVTREPWVAPPTGHPAVSSEKAPVGYEPAPAYPSPIGDVPEFESTEAGRKASRTFGRMSSATRDPLEVETQPLAPAGAVSAPAYVAYPEPVQPRNGSTLAPVPSSLNTPMVVNTPPPADAPAPRMVPVSAPAEPSAAPGPAPAAVSPPAEAAPAAPQMAAVAETPGDGAAPAAVSEPALAAATTAPSDTAADAPEETAAADDTEEEAKLAKVRETLARLWADLGRVPEGEGKISVEDGQLVVTVQEEAQRLLAEVEELRGDKGRPLAGALGDTWWDLINLKSQAAKLGRRFPESLAAASGSTPEEEASEPAEPKP